MLTDAEKNRIKRDIGNVFHQLLTLAEVKRAIRIPAYVRSEKDTARIVKLLKSQEIFKDKQFSNQEFRELADNLTFREYQADEVIYSYDHQPKNFYMVLSGQVNIEIKNPDIDQWDWANDIYKSLDQWKEKEFNLKVEQQMRLHLIKEKLRADTK